MAAESRHSLICVFFPSTNFATFFQKKTFWRCAGTNDPMPGDPSFSVVPPVSTSPQVGGLDRRGPASQVRRLLRSRRPPDSGVWPLLCCASVPSIACLVLHLPINQHFPQKACFRHQFSCPVCAKPIFILSASRNSGAKPSLGLGRIHPVFRECGHAGPSHPPQGLKVKFRISMVGYQGGQLERNTRLR